MKTTTTTNINDNHDAGSMLYFKDTKSLVASVHRSVVWTANQRSVTYADFNRPSRPHVLESSWVLSIGALPTENKQAASLSKDGYVRIIHAPANGLAIRVNELVHTPGGTCMATCLRSVPDFIVSMENEIVQFDGTTCRQKSRYDLSEQVSALMLLPESMVIGHESGRVSGYDLRNRKRSFHIEDIPPNNRPISFSMLGNTLYVGSLDGGLGMVDVRKGKSWSKIHWAPSKSIYATETKIISCDSVNGDIYSFFHGNLTEYIRTHVGSCVHVGYTGEVIVVAG